ncbi:molybdopterin-containing oxidoreductase family protein [Thiohalomonas denitrificans]|uniref:molybdopterin-containing oxidoreductase family protein n=1 Tax=Thiohalomonas denitrificans TaxID=415747 RepID=UPI0026EE957A|nr:molybdopterin-dependent oxidoreductase [Thiohalomonas denitrificans]
MATEQVYGYCPLCISRCGCISTITDGRLTAVEPNPGHPTGRHLCIKGRAAPELVYSPGRLLRPLRRTRPKGASDPGWQPVSWDEALSEIAERMQAIRANHGSEGVAFGVTTPSGTSIADAFGWIHRLAHAFGSPNVMFATENCNWHKDQAPAETFGSGIGVPDFENADCILLWGFNPAVTWPAYADAILQAKRRGARLVVVDPRRAGLAGRADSHLQPRPGTDGVLALGLAGLMMERGWFDHDFIRNWSNGPFLVRPDGQMLTEADLRGGNRDRRVVWDEGLQRPLFYDPATRAFNEPAKRPALFGSYTLQTATGPLTCRPAFELYAQECRAYTTDRVAEETGVLPEQLENTARLLFEARPLAYYHWTGICQQLEATQIGRAIGLLYALTGSLDAPGGNVRFPRPALNDISGRELLNPAQAQKSLGHAERPLGPPAKGWITTRDLARAVLDGAPYPVRGLINFGANFRLTKPATPGLEAMLKELDLFVHVDLFENPTARFADFLLPAASPWERSGLAAGFQLGERGEALLQLRPAVIPPRGESRSDSDIVFDLAERLGLSDRFFGGDREAGLRHTLAPGGVGAGTLRAHPQGVPAAGPTRYRKYRQKGFETPSGRIEIYSERLLDAGHAPLPQFGATEQRDAGYPLALTTAKWPQFCHSQHRGLPSLRRRLPDPLVQLHPDTAAARGIIDGQWVLLQTPVGRMQAKAQLDGGIRPDTVCAQYGWWEACPELGLPGHALGGVNNSSYNALISGERFDPISGSNGLRTQCCQILPLAPGQEAHSRQ